MNRSIRHCVDRARPLGSLLGGALGEAIGPRGALLMAGAGVLLTPLWLLFSPVRSLRTVVSGRT
jgi:hypothetical protein